MKSSKDRYSRKFRPTKIYNILGPLQNWALRSEPGASFRHSLYAPSAHVNASHSSVKGAEASMNLGSDLEGSQIYIFAYGMTT